MLLSEVMHQQYPINWIKRNEGFYSASYNISPDVILEAEFILDEENTEDPMDVWVLEFMINGSIAKLDEKATKFAHTIITVVHQAIVEFIQKIKRPFKLMFGANSPSKQKVYKTLISRLPFKFTVNTVSHGSSDKWFILTFE